MFTGELVSLEGALIGAPTTNPLNYMYMLNPPSQFSRLGIRCPALSLSLSLSLSLTLSLSLSLSHIIKTFLSGIHHTQKREDKLTVH